MAPLSRREFGKLAAYFGAIAAAGYCFGTNRNDPPSSRVRIGELDAGDRESEWRALNRLSFGPRPGDLERISAIGIHAYVDEQLAPESIPGDPSFAERLAHLETLDLDASEAHDFEDADRGDNVLSPVFRTLLQLPNPALGLGAGQTSRDLQQAAVLRAAYSNRQLEEVMVEFWSDHFNIDQTKRDCAWLKTVDDRTLRPHALGRFRDLLWVSAQSPAMLFYLDNTQNFRSAEPGGLASNENYARELLELHTVGVDGGYTLRDVQEVAKCFTGWTTRGDFDLAPGAFVFDPVLHDDGDKFVMGQAILAGGGQVDGFEVLDRLSRHPSTAQFIARKLCRRFVADQPPEDLVAQIADVFQATDGDIRRVLTALLHGPEFAIQAGPKLKRPFDFAISAIRATGSEIAGETLLGELERMGQAPFRHAAPDGYPDRVDAWKQGLVSRWEFAIRLADGSMADTPFSSSSMLAAIGETEPLAVCRRLSRVLIGRTLPEPQLTALASLCQTDDLDRSFRQWTALLLSSPQFQCR
jgi:Protein of unknown function (DUF1800)